MTEQPETVDLDLFGSPITSIRERWGRPSYKKTEENQKLVALLRSAGWSHERIAAQMGCDEKTLRKHFSRELQAGADMIEAEGLQVLYTKMRTGNVGATEKLLDRIDDARLKPTAPVQRQPKPEKLGKKETLNREAASPSGSWSDVLQ